MQIAAPHRLTNLAAMRLRSRAAPAIAAWAEAEQGRFALWLPVLMAAGAVAYYSLTWEPPWWSGSAVLALLLAAGIALFRRPELRPALWSAAAVALGFASGQLATFRAPGIIDLPSRATIVTGAVAAVEQTPRGRRVTLEHPSLDQGQPLPRALRLRLKPGDELPIAPGDTLTVRALLSRPAPPAFPGAWDLQRDAFHAGLAGYGFALNPASAAPGPPQPGWRHLMPALRATIAARIAAALPAEEGAIAATLLTGSTAAIPEPDRAAFRDSGLAHLLAIAGLHIGIVMGLSFAAARLLLALSEHATLHWPTKQAAALASLAAGGFYLLLTGAHVPIIRSFAMACLVTLGVLAGRRAVSLRGLALAMAALILIAPAEVMGVSFQMSFSAVLALIAGYAALRPWLQRLHGDGSWRRRVLGHVVALALTSALAGTASAPYGAYHFGHVQLYYVLANLIAVPLTAFWVMPAGMLALLLMPVHLEVLALLPMGWGIDAILWVGRSVAALPAAVLAVPHIPAWGLGLLSLGIAWAGLWRTRLRLAGWPMIAIGLLSPVFDRPPDLLISADARLIALRTPNGLFVQKSSGAQRFTLDAWLQYLARDAALPLPLNSESPDLSCTPATCTLHAAGRTALLLRADPDPSACAADLLISAEPIRLGCPQTPAIDRFSVWRDGAHAAWLSPDGARILSDRAFRGDRPWVPPIATRTRIPPNLTPAATEDLPPE